MSVKNVSSSTGDELPDHIKPLEFAYSSTRDSHSFFWGSQQLQPPRPFPITTIVSLELCEDVILPKPYLEDEDLWSCTFRAIADEPGWRVTYLGRHIDAKNLATLLIGIETRQAFRLLDACTVMRAKRPSPEQSGTGIHLRHLLPRQQPFVQLACHRCLLF